MESISCHVPGVPAPSPPSFTSVFPASISAIVSPIGPCFAVISFESKTSASLKFHKSGLNGGGGRFWCATTKRKLCKIRSARLSSVYKWTNWQAGLKLLCMVNGVGGRQGSSVNGSLVKLQYIAQERVFHRECDTETKVSRKKRNSINGGALISCTIVCNGDKYFSSLIYSVCLMIKNVWKVVRTGLSPSGSNRISYTLKARNSTILLGDDVVHSHDGRYELRWTEWLSRINGMEKQNNFVFLYSNE